MNWINQKYETLVAARDTVHAYHGGERMFRGLSLQDAHLAGTSWVDAAFLGCDFTGVDFSGSDFTGATFYGCDFSDADLNHARFEGAIFHDSERTVFQGASLNNSVLHDAKMCGADLNGATLDGVDFYAADLRGVEHFQFTPKFERLTHPWTVTILADHIQIGCQTHSTYYWENLLPFKLCMMHPFAEMFWTMHRTKILSLAKELRNIHEVENDTLVQTRRR